MGRWPELKAAERYRRQGNFAKSEKIYRRFLAADGDNAVALIGLAALMEDQERFEDALAGFRRAAALAPDDASLCTELGNALIRNGELEEAAASLGAPRWQALAVPTTNWRPACNPRPAAAGKSSDTIGSTNVSSKATSI